MDTIIIIAIINMAFVSLGYYFCFVALGRENKKVVEEEKIYNKDEFIEDEEAFVPERD